MIDFDRFALLSARVFSKAFVHRSMQASQMYASSFPLKRRLTWCSSLPQIQHFLALSYILLKICFLTQYICQNLRLFYFYTQLFYNSPCFSSKRYLINAPILSNSCFERSPQASISFLIDLSISSTLFLLTQISFLRDKGIVTAE